MVLGYAAAATWPAPFQIWPSLMQNKLPLSFQGASRQKGDRILDKWPSVASCFMSPTILSISLAAPKERKSQNGNAQHRFGGEAAELRGICGRGRS